MALIGFSGELWTLSKSEHIELLGGIRAQNEAPTKRILFQAYGTSLPPYKIHFHSHHSERGPSGLDLYFATGRTFWHDQDRSLNDEIHIVGTPSAMWLMIASSETRSKRLSEMARKSDKDGPPFFSYQEFWTDHIRPVLPISRNRFYAERNDDGSTREHNNNVIRGAASVHVALYRLDRNGDSAFHRSRPKINFAQE
jgi:hypothetical protein